jgi:uncharacterized membrane protein
MRENHGKAMPTETGAATALITNDAVVPGLLAAILGAVFWASNLSHPWVKRFFTVIPAPAAVLFLPSLLTTFGVVDPEECASISSPRASCCPPPWSLLTVSADLPAVFGLGPKALIMFSPPAPSG